MFTTKNTALLAPYGSTQFMPLATKVGEGKNPNPQFIAQSSNGEGKGFGISTATDPGKIPSAS